MKRFSSCIAVLGFAVAVASTEPAAAACTVPLFEQLRNRIEFDCDPYGCPKGRAGFAACVRRVLRDSALAGTGDCNPILDANYLQSTYCRSPESVACHMTTAAGVDRCRIARNIGRCRAPRGGSSCVTFLSCGEPCP